MNSLSNRPPSYCSYILRCWQENATADQVKEAAGAVMRFSLEDPHTGERFGFAVPETLIAFLRAKIEGCPEMEEPAAK